MTEPRPLLRVVRGEPDDAELAALTAVVTATVVTAVVSGPGSANDGSAKRPEQRSRWADRAALVRQPLPTGPGAWRASAFPH
ncbi:MAG TPA: acyl-CoA carboxylase epsilon subunit [Pseudonocardiaceae bacterium]|nr:acyl-CoA carboxylase epsilon subunit [Pseudonocardiaceae bacterium]